MSDLLKPARIPSATTNYFSGSRGGSDPDGEWVVVCWLRVDVKRRRRGGEAEKKVAARQSVCE
jgi:hypothetical protein